MHKKSTLLSVSVFFLLFIGVSDYGYACHRGPESNDGGGCGKVDGEGSNTFQVHLAGAFVSNPPVLVVVLNEKRTIARSETPIDMTRPDDDPLILQNTWDGVFGTCPVLLEGLEVESMFVGRDDWTIRINTGEIRLGFADIDLTTSTACPGAEEECPIDDVIDDVDLILQLIGDLDLNLPLFPPGPEDIFDIDLLRFDIRGSTVRGIHPRERCGLDIMPFLPLLAPPILTICGEEVKAVDCHPPL